MREVTDECVGCTTDGLPCVGEGCLLKRTTRYYCDRCKEEFEPEELYVDEDDSELCTTCILLRFPTVAELEESEE